MITFKCDICKKEEIMNVSSIPEGGRFPLMSINEAVKISSRIDGRTTNITNGTVEAYLKNIKMINDVCGKCFKIYSELYDEIAIEHANKIPEELWNKIQLELLRQ